MLRSAVVVWVKHGRKDLMPAAWNVDSDQIETDFAVETFDLELAVVAAAVARMEKLQNVDLAYMD